MCDITSDNIPISCSTPRPGLSTSRSLPSLPTSILSGVQGSGAPTTTPVFTFPPPVSPATAVSRDTTSISTNTTTTTYTDSGTITEIQQISDTGILYSFSPKLCLELLSTLTKKQLDYEYDYFYLRSKGFSEHKYNMRRPNEVLKRAAVEKHFVEGLFLDSEKYVYSLDHYSALTNDFSNTLEDLKNWLAEMEGRHSSVHTLEPDTTNQQTATEEVDSHLTSEPVWFLPFVVPTDFCNIDDLCEELMFTDLGSRECCYFGSRPYSYNHKSGTIQHEASPYPTTGTLRAVLDLLVDNIVDPDFNLENYTCLVTRYDGNDSFIPYHSDDEIGICPNSNIYTLTLGAQRSLNFRSKDRTDFRSCCPQSGSIYVMSRLSQDVWEHAVPSCRKPGPSYPRLSLTLRHMTDGQPPQPPAGIPRPPPPPEFADHCPLPPKSGGQFPASPPRQPPPSPPRHVLFLTDSINAKLDCSKFSGNIICDKRLCFRLRDVTQYEKLFPLYDMVIFSNAVNDFIKDNHCSGSLIKIMGPKFEYFSRQYPNTTFVYNSVLHTSDVYLNDEIDKFNLCVFKLSLRIDDNFWFLDTHTKCVDLYNKTRAKILHDGTHLTTAASKFVEKCIISTISGNVFFDLRVFTTWPLRPRFADIARNHRSKPVY